MKFLIKDKKDSVVEIDDLDELFKPHLNITNKSHTLTPTEIKHLKWDILRYKDTKEIFPDIDQYLHTFFTDNADWEGPISELFLNALDQHIFDMIDNGKIGGITVE